MTNILKKINELSSYSKNKSDTHGEVFTPFPLIEQMCDAISKTVWLDSKHTFFDPCAGKGNMPAVIVTRLMTGLSEEIPNENERYKHIMEKQIYMAEFQRESALDIEKIFNPTGKLKLNLYVGDFLVMPEDFFDLSFQKRMKTYPQHCIHGKIPKGVKSEPGKKHSKPLW